MKKQIAIISLAFMMITNIGLFANNLQINNLSISSTNNVQEYAIVQFDLSWENSWRDASNYDAAWVFIKYRITGNTGAWSHATLNLSGHTAAAGSTIETPSDGKGVFIYRNASGSGTLNLANIELRWNYGTDGLASSDNIDLKIFGIEMVYVPSGAFSVGDGQTNAPEIYGNFEAGTSGNPFIINNENAITLGGGGAGSLGNNNGTQMFDHPDCSGCLPGSGDDFNDAVSQTLPAAFPKGFNAFYCMKYELTQEQFVGMLNCSTAAQQAALTDATGFVGSTERYGISQIGGVYSTTEPYVPLNFCDWKKAAAYADWSALRPMTELEFEKACRGFDAPIINEYAWGNANVDLSDNLILNNISAANEGIASGYDGGGTNGNVWVRAGSQTMTGIARVGIFSANGSNTGRVTSGATVWGIMEMSGNAWERVVSVGHSEGRHFTGQHGDGNIDANGLADISSWPGTFGGAAVNSNVGVGYRGGALQFPTPNLERNARVSSRRLNSGYWDLTIKDDGARFVRSAD